MSNHEFDPGFDESTMSTPSISTDSLFSALIHDYGPTTTQPSPPHKLDDICYEGMSRSVPYETENITISNCIGGSFSWPIKPEADFPILSDLAGVSIKKDPDGTVYEHILDSATIIYGVMGPLTYPNSSSLCSVSSRALHGATSFTMAPTPSPCAQPHDGLDDQVPEFKTSEPKQHSRRLLGGCSLYGINIPSQMHLPHTMVNDEAEQMAPELHSHQPSSSGKQSPKRKSAPVDVVGRATCKCDYPGCHKTFRRKEHLKRHKKSFHGEGPNRFSCEFCGKDQFNRQDNLNSHRKLHAQPKSRNCGVEHITAAVPVIEQEGRSRKRRKSSKAKGAGLDHEILNE
ncbi:hypothetical protein CEP51_015913 [Fusarium floridanum]|uniref:C2H2-type domain-containing protein n=1 Tax=Fusarium floridanum TaxID=1325733 RepID=A0A428P0G4_9HYPO|nr:hypothetical protein CEP51_015913 [Fusarium floridanum]